VEARHEGSLHLGRPMIEEKLERRKYPRFKSSFPISFQLFRGQARYSDSRPVEAIATGIRGTVGNVSFEGLYVEANPTNEQLSELMGMNENPDLFFIHIETELMGEVVWYDVSFPDEGPCHFRAGVFLGELPGQTRQLWHSLIDSLS